MMTATTTLNDYNNVWEGYVGVMIEEKRRMFIKVHEEKIVRKIKETKKNRENIFTMNESDRCIEYERIMISSPRRSRIYVYVCVFLCKL